MPRISHHICPRSGARSPFPALNPRLFRELAAPTSCVSHALALDDTPRVSLRDRGAPFQFFHTRGSQPVVKKVRNSSISPPDPIHHLKKRTASMYVPGGGSRARSLATLLFACSLLGVHGGSLIGCAASGTALRGHGGVRDFSPVMGKGLAACFLGPCAVPDVLGAAAATDRSALRLRGGSPTADGAHDEGGAGCRGRLVKIFVTYCGS
jgi:hypothetical protein